MSQGLLCPTIIKKIMKEFQKEAYQIADKKC